MTSYEQFHRYVVSSAGSIVAVAFLGPSQDDYAKSYRSLQAIASEYLHAVELRVDVFWVNAEVHKEFAKHVGASRVPSLVFFLPITREGKKGLKWLEGPFELSRIRKFMATSMLKGEGITEYTTPTAEVAERLFVKSDSSAWLDTEMVPTAADEPEPSLSAGKKTSAKPSTDPKQQSTTRTAKSSSDAKKKKSSKTDEDDAPKAKKKRAPTKKELEREEKLKKDMEAKKAAKEKRVKEKAEREAKDREAKKEKTKKKLEKQQQRKQEEEEKNKSNKKKKGGSSSGTSSAGDDKSKKSSKDGDKKKETKTEQPKKDSKKESSSGSSANQKKKTSSSSSSKVEKEKRKEEATQYAQQDGEYISVDDL